MQDIGCYKIVKFATNQLLSCWATPKDPTYQPYNDMNVIRPIDSFSSEHLFFRRKARLQVHFDTPKFFLLIYDDRVEDIYGDRSDGLSSKIFIKSYENANTIVVTLQPQIYVLKEVFFFNQLEVDLLKSKLVEYVVSSRLL